MKRWLLRQLFPNPIVRLVMLILGSLGLGRALMRRALLRRMRGQLAEWLDDTVGEGAGKVLVGSDSGRRALEALAGPSVDWLIRAAFK